MIIGKIENANAIGLVENMKNGDRVEVYLNIKNDIIYNISAQVFSDVDLVEQTKTVLNGINNRNIIEILECNLDCTILAYRALKNAINNYLYENNREEEMILNVLCSSKCCSTCSKNCKK